MAVATIRVAPDSTGSYLRTRTRTENSLTVHEQIVRAVSNDRAGITTGWASTPRIPARAVTTQVLAVLFNGGSNVVAVRRCSVETDSAVAKTVLAPWMRGYRVSAVTSGSGTAVTTALSDTTATALSTGIVVTADASADGTNSGTALAVTALGPNVWQQVVPRWATLVGYAAVPPMNLIPDDSSFENDSPLLLRNGQGYAVRFDAPAALTAGDFQFGVKFAFDEVTLPY